MESFVPFGGLFSAPSDLKLPVNDSGSFKCLPRCCQCNEKCEEEVFALSREAITTTVAEQYQSSLPSWLQMAALGPSKELEGKVCITFNLFDLVRVFNSIQSEILSISPSTFSNEVVGFPKSQINCEICQTSEAGTMRGL